MTAATLPSHNPLPSQEDHWGVVEKYIRQLSAADFCSLMPSKSDRDPAERASRGSAFYAGPCLDFLAVETHADIIIALDRGDRREVIRLFRQLQKMIGKAPFERTSRARPGGNGNTPKVLER